MNHFHESLLPVSMRELLINIVVNLVKMAAAKSGCERIVVS